MMDESQSVGIFLHHSPCAEATPQPLFLCEKGLYVGWAVPTNLEALNQSLDANRPSHFSSKADRGPDRDQFFWLHPSVVNCRISEMIFDQSTTGFLSLKHPCLN